MTYKDDARSSQAGKAKRMIGSETDSAPKIAASEGSKTTGELARRLVRACGGRVSGSSSAKRLDKPARARGGRVNKGKTTVNVIVSPQGGQQGPGAPAAMALPPAPPPVAVAGPPGGGASSPPPPGGVAGPPRPPMGPPPMPMRARGGKVMKAGAGSGLGRLEKAGL